MPETRLTHMTVGLAHTVTVSPEGYQKLCELAERYKVCQRCSKPYTGERPNVALNICLPCFLACARTQHRSLRFVGKAEKEGVFLYMDNTKFIHYSTITSGESFRSHVETLNYWKYPYPQDICYDGGDVNFTPGDWQLHGRPGASAAVIVWKDASLTKKSFVFLTYRGGAYQYLDKRQRATRALFAQARERAELTRDEQGCCHLTFEYGDYLRDTLTDEDLYPVIAQLASEEHDAGHSPCVSAQ